MMNYWPWWISGLALSGVMLVHWLTLHRMMAVSGRVSALVDRFRHGKSAPAVEMSPEELLAAIQAATFEEFGEEAEPERLPAKTANVFVPKAPVPTSFHAVFFLGLVLGGTLATLPFALAPTTILRSEGFSALSRETPALAWGLLFTGGAFVGFGTRMAGGCTSGHGLCGTSRLQPGSLLATVAFFITGIAVSFGLGALL